MEGEGGALLWGARRVRRVMYGGAGWEVKSVARWTQSTEEGRENAGREDEDGGGGAVQSCQTPESPGQKWNKCWLVLILSNEHPATDSGTKLRRKGTINLGLL